jgi:hypothetical protein
MDMNLIWVPEDFLVPVDLAVRWAHGIHGCGPTAHSSTLVQEGLASSTRGRLSVGDAVLVGFVVVVLAWVGRRGNRKA